jgi:hypothetical protein
LIARGNMGGYHCESCGKDVVIVLKFIVKNVMLIFVIIAKMELNMKFKF